MLFTVPDQFMNITTTIEETRQLVQSVKTQYKRIALVPTMGNLHEGHLTLVRKARELGDYVIVSIYVNPMQFGFNEDFSSYPRTFESDCYKLQAENVDAVFAPTSKVMYPEGKDEHTAIQVNALDGMHCGKSRPVFFTGIATVVCKLFNIASPDIAVFGEKDFQQLCVIKKMVRDLSLPVKVVGIPIVRAESGLALSSRNRYLSDKEMQIAPLLRQVIHQIADEIKRGNYDFDELSEKAKQQLTSFGFKPDYFNIVSQNTLKSSVDNDNSLIILTACMLGKTRLIDNEKIQLA